MLRMATLAPSSYDDGRRTDVARLCCCYCSGCRSYCPAVHWANAILLLLHRFSAAAAAADAVGIDRLLHLHAACRTCCQAGRATSWQVDFEMSRQKRSSICRLLATRDAAGRPTPYGNGDDRTRWSRPHRHGCHRIVSSGCCYSISKSATVADFSAVHRNRDSPCLSPSRSYYRYAGNNLVSSSKRAKPKKKFLPMDR